MLAATVICLLMTVSGLVIAYQPDLPAGATIIVVAGVFYAIAIASSSVLKQLQKKTVTS